MPDVMKTVGRYEILREVGRGGMAMVYLARQTDLDRFVALKELGAFHASDPSFAQRFLRESRVAGSLSHPNIVTVHDYFEHEGTPYIAMEYIERGSLRPHVGHMTLAQIGGVLEGLLAGLAHGEQHGIVHRDLKPENLMVTSDGRVKIADFGIAKATNQMQTGAFLTATGTTVGTPTYMAPEQAMAQDIGPSTDLYSVGCMSFELFTGRVPFHDTEAPMAILLRHVNEPIPPASSIDPKIDADISSWIERLLLKDPGQRTQSANEAWDQFEEIIIGLLGPRWRREARLREGSSQQIDTAPPLTPAPFEGTTSDAAVSDEFQSFAWGSAVTPDEAPPGPATPPPSESLPVPPDPIVGPPTPLPSQAVPAAGARAPEAPPEEDEGFVTFGAPAASEPPVVAAGDPLASEAPPVEAGNGAAAEAEAEAPAPAAEAPPVEQPAEEEEAFETYIAPAPLRPPTEDAPPDAPALPPAEPPVAEPPVPEPPVAEPARVEEPVAAPPPLAPPTPAPAPAPVSRDDELAPTVMPSSVKAPPPTPPKAPPRPPREEPKREPVPAGERSNKGLLIGFGIAVVVFAVVGLMVGRGGGGGDEGGGGGAPTAAQRGGQLEALFPAGWAKLPSPPEIPGMELSEPVAAAPDGAAGGESVVFGTVKEAANNSTLLPATFLTALGLDSGEFPRRDAVRLASNKIEAYRYTNLRPEGLGQAVTIFAAPTSEGVATLACVKPGADCESIANTLKITSGEPFPVGPSKAYTEALGKELGALNRAAKSGSAKLKAAKTGKAQAAAAEDIAAAYDKASANLSKAKVSPADQAANAQLVAGLKETGRGYDRLATAASKNDRAGYRRASTAIRRGEQEIGGAIRGLQAAGYKIGG